MPLPNLRSSFCSKRLSQSATHLHDIPHPNRFDQARDVAGFKERFEQEVLDFVTPLFQGFLRRPLPTVQGPDCLYSVEAVGEEEAGESGQVRVPQLLVAPQPAEEVARRQAHLRTSPK